MPLMHLIPDSLYSPVASAAAFSQAAADAGNKRGGVRLPEMISSSCPQPLDFLLELPPPLAAVRPVLRGSQGYLQALKRISSGSGGSITSHMLGAAWQKLKFGGEGVARRPVDEVKRPLRRLAGRKIDVQAALLSLLSPYRREGHIGWCYRRSLGVEHSARPPQRHGRAAYCHRCYQTALKGAMALFETLRRRLRSTHLR